MKSHPLSAAQVKGAANRSDCLRAEWPGGRALALLGLLLLSAMLLAARPAGAADLGFRGLGFQAGAVSPSGWDTGYEVAVHLDFGEITRGLRLQPTLAYWTAPGTDHIFGHAIDRDLSNLAVGADALWYPERDRRGWYVGGGAYLNRIEYEVLGARLSTNRVGANGIGGYDFSLGGYSAFVEARYHVVSGFNTVQLGLGIRLGG